MTSFANISRRVENGFDVIGLFNTEIAVETVPALGARLLSLRDLVTGREWLWRPADHRGLFASRAGDAFESSPLAGADECLPTIAPCRLDRRDLPDHGECWAAAWTLASPSEHRAKIQTTLELPVSPLRLERVLALHHRTARLDYTLTNLSDAPQPWLYAFHALFPIEPGDRVELPGGALPPPCPENEYAKAFVPATLPRAVLHRANGSALKIEWNGAALPWLAVFITRGGWNHHRHLALEPTNADADTPLGKTVPHLPPRGVIHWSVRLEPVVRR